MCVCSSKHVRQIYSKRIRHHHLIPFYLWHLFFQRIHNTDSLLHKRLCALLVQQQHQLQQQQHPRTSLTSYMFDNNVRESMYFITLCTNETRTGSVLSKNCKIRLKLFNYFVICCSVSNKISYGTDNEKKKQTISNEKTIFYFFFCCKIILGQVSVKQ